MGSRISVIIPTHNRLRFVQKAINSILRQTVPVAEIIIVDDGSTDGTSKALSTHSNITYLHQPQQGPSAARNVGALMADGDWIAFLDSDDRWLPEKCERQLRFFRQNPELKVSYTNEIWIRDGVRVNQKKRHAKHGGWIYEKCLPLCIISPSSIMMERETWLASGGFDETLPACEDYDLWLRLSAKVPIGFIDEFLIEKIGGHADQLSRQWGLDKFRLIALEKMMSNSELSPSLRRLTYLEFIKKARILDLGYKKHRRCKEAGILAEKIAHWQRILA